jgi:hypothetical protein
MTQNPPAWIPPDNWFIYTVIFVAFLGLAIALGAVARRLGATATHWSLADALSEEADLTVPDAAGFPYTVNGVVIKKTELAASSSRLIAFMRMLAILFLFLGFGAFILWGFAKTGAMPASAGDITKYLLGGMTLFAPYIVNKFSSVFAPKSRTNAHDRTTATNPTLKWDHCVAKA